MIPGGIVGIAVAVAAAGAGAWTDFRSGRIPNLLTGAAAVLGLSTAVIGNGITGLMAAVIGGAGCALVPMLLHRFGAMGGGDVKLFAALGILLGLDLGLEAQSASFMLGAVQGVVVWARQGRLAGGLMGTAALAIPVAGRRIRARPKVRAASKTTLRFGPAMAAGCVLAVLLEIF